MPLVDQTVLSISMFDKLGRKFDNFSSIFVEWQLSDFSLGTLQRGLSDDAEDPAQRTVYHRKFLNFSSNTAVVSIDSPKCTDIWLSILGVTKVNVSIVK